MTAFSYPSPRERKESVWCCHFLRCWGVGVPGYVGGAGGELCELCEAKRVMTPAHVGGPEPEPQPEGEPGAPHQ